MVNRPGEVVTAAPEPVERPTVRIVLIGPGDLVLLFRWRNPEPAPAVWFTPGGGVRPGESYERAALRELREEVGLRDVELGPFIWTREHTLTVRGVPSRLIERFFVARAPSLEVDTSGFDEVERSSITDHRWMAVEEIARMTETVAPAALARLLRPIVRGEYPAQPIDAGI